MDTKSKSQEKREAIQKDAAKKPERLTSQTITEPQIIARTIASKEKLPIIPIKANVEIRNGDMVKLTIIGKAEAIIDQGRSLLGISRQVVLTELQGEFEKAVPCAENRQTVMPIKK